MIGVREERLAILDFNYVRDLVRVHSAIVLEAGKEWLVQSRLAPLVQKAGVSSIAELVTLLKKSSYSPLHRLVVEAIATNETSFFRDHHPFEAMRQWILPALIRSRAAERRITLWSAACSSGQEPYSLAMLLAEHFPLPGWNVRILATDISTEMIARAREGCYTQMEVNRGLPAPYLIKYFDKVGGQWKIKDSLRRLIEFREMNLDAEWPGHLQADLVLLRNVLIYFEPPTKKTVLGRVRRVLRKDGFLLLGAAETTINLDPAFEMVPLGRMMCYQVRGDGGSPPPAFPGGRPVAERRGAGS